MPTSSTQTNKQEIGACPVRATQDNIFKMERDVIVIQSIWLLQGLCPALFLQKSPCMALTVRLYV